MQASRSQYNSIPLVSTVLYTLYCAPYSSIYIYIHMLDYTVLNWHTILWLDPPTVTSYYYCRYTGALICPYQEIVTIRGLIRLGL